MTDSVYMIGMIDVRKARMNELANATTLVIARPLWLRQAGSASSAPGSLGIETTHRN
jgi:hypothetical protein